MILSFDCWHRGRSFGFDILLWERFWEGETYEELIKLEFNWQIKLFGRVWSSNNYGEKEEASEP